MRIKAQLVKWELSILALIIISITTFAGEQLVTHASANIKLSNKRSCQLVNNTGGDTQLTVSPQIPSQLTKLLENKQYSLQCNNTHINAQNAQSNTAPCIEQSIAMCTSNTRTMAGVAANLSAMTTPPNGSVACTSQGNNTICTIAVPASITLPSNGSVNCIIQNDQITCNASGVISTLTTVIGVTLPPNATLSCIPQANQIVCNVVNSVGSKLDPNAILSCVILNGQIICKGTLSPNGMLPSNGNVNCVPQVNQVICTITALSGTIPTPTSISTPTPTSTPTSGLNSTVSCDIQSGQTVCTITVPAGVTLPPNVAVTCGIQNKQIVCSASGLIALLSVLLGITLPSDVPVSCENQNNQIVCTIAGTPTSNALVSCVNQNSLLVCKGALPSGLIPPTLAGIVSTLNVAITVSCLGHNNQLVCVIPFVLSSGKMARQLTLDRQLFVPSCQLRGAEGNTQLILSSEIPDQLKKALEKNDGTVKYSLQCNNS